MIAPLVRSQNIGAAVIPSLTTSSLLGSPVPHGLPNGKGIAWDLTLDVIRL